MHAGLITLLSVLSDGRIIHYAMSNGDEVLERQLLPQPPVDPSTVAFYGFHHQNPYALCNELTSTTIVESISTRIAEIEELLSSGQYVKLQNQYPHIFHALGTDPIIYKQFIRSFRDSLKHARQDHHVLQGEQLGEFLRDVSIRSLRAVGGDKMPSKIKVENLRTLNADMLHLGEEQVDLYQAVVHLIDCINVHSLHEPINVQQKGEPVVVEPKADRVVEPPQRDVGHDIEQMHSGQDSESQASTSMIIDVNQLLHNADLGVTFHPLKDPSVHEKLLDPYYPYQWYLGGPPEQKYGGNFMRAWELMLGIPEGSGFDSITGSDFPKSPIGDTDFTIAIVDMGCGANDDLLYDASNPICHNDKTLIGNANNVDISEDNVVALKELSNQEEMGAKIEDTLDAPLVAGADYCGGSNSATSDDVHILNEGHEALQESYFKDPTNHGTSTASVIGAGWNDDSGIAGLCPFCNVKCIKISADDTNVAQVNMTGVFRSLEFLASFADRYPISNHSYGGFFLDPREIEGHRRLSQAGGLVVAAAGNYGCDIDPLAKAFGAFANNVSGLALESTDASSLAQSKCKKNNGDLSIMPMMPASIQLPSFMSVGAIGNDGEISNFSNWGKDTVTMNAPGETIVSLRARDADFNKGGNDEIMIQHGTSFAAPIASAAAALVYRHMETNCHEPTAEEIIAILTQSVTPTSGQAAENKSQGTLNVFEALKSIENRC